MQDGQYLCWTLLPASCVYSEQKRINKKGKKSEGQVADLALQPSRMRPVQDENRFSIKGAAGAALQGQASGGQLLRETPLNAFHAQVCH